MHYSSSCSECPNGASIDNEQMAGKHSWAVSVSCRGCNMYWFICSVCRYKGTVVRLSSDAARYRHHCSHHAKGNRCCSMATTSRILPPPYNVIKVTLAPILVTNNFHKMNKIALNTPQSGPLLMIMGLLPSASRLSQWPIHQVLLPNSLGMYTVLVTSQLRCQKTI